jgi:DNA-binding response OmpR family regulator
MVVLGSPKTVLLVDKQVKGLVYLAKPLRMAGFQTLYSMTGSGAIKSIKENAPDLVVLEVDLSDMDGIDVVKAVRENTERAQARFIAISAYPHMKAKCLDNGCDGFFQKPVKLLDFVSQVRKLTKATAKHW